MRTQEYRNLLDWAFAQSGLDLAEKVVLLCLSKLGFATGRAFASQATIAKMAGCSVSTVGRALRKLTQRGLIFELVADRAERATKTYGFAFRTPKAPIKQNDRVGNVIRPATLCQIDRQNPELESKSESRGNGEARPIMSPINKLLKKFGAGF